MKNKTLETIMNNQEVTLDEAMELIDVYEYATLHLTNASGRELSLEINRCDDQKGSYVFSQHYYSTENSYTVMKDEIVSHEIKYQEHDSRSRFDYIFITCHLKDDSKLDLIIFKHDSYVKKECDGEYEFLDTSEAEDLFAETTGEDSKWKYAIVTINDIRGFSSTYIFVNVSYDEDEMELVIKGKEGSAKINLEGETEIYFREDEYCREFLIRPNNLPFMRIELSFH
ncbi:MAG: hypothetical protein LUF92_03735 [Clostridiales bacterium]|nr:hypothetical protein [Clostridiales bacterium]